jgi:hypothetical protein
VLPADILVLKEKEEELGLLIGISTFPSVAVTSLTTGCSYLS